MKASNLGERLIELDSFAAPVPRLNIKGREKIATKIGVCMTLLKLTVTFAFALLKSSQLVQHHNPTINTHTEKLIESGESFDLKTLDFQIAVGL